MWNSEEGSSVSQYPSRGEVAVGPRGVKTSCLSGGGVRAGC